MTPFDLFNPLHEAEAKATINSDPSSSLLPAMQVFAVDDEASLSSLTSTLKEIPSIYAVTEADQAALHIIEDEDDISNNDEVDGGSSYYSHMPSMCSTDSDSSQEEEEDVSESCAYTTSEDTPVVFQETQRKRRKQHVRKVSFHEEVAVQEIPSYRDYCESTRDNLWNSLRSISKNVKRNTIEFMADGWDWKAASEEDQMVCLSSGQLVHPATWMLYAPVRRSSNSSSARRQPRTKRYQQKQALSLTRFADS